MIAERQEGQGARQDAGPDIEADAEIGVMILDASTSKAKVAAPVAKIRYSYFRMDFWKPPPFKPGRF